MKRSIKNAPIVTFVSIFVLGALLQLTCSAPPALPQTSPVVNPPPCDFNDNFYNANGINVTNLDLQAAGRFGTFRQTGPPASSFNGGTNNWVPDTTCSVNDPTRRNFRILATTGAYRDDNGAPTEFLSIIAFLLNQNFFTGVANKRNIQMVDIVGNFEAYTAPTQKVNGALAPAPCGTMGDGLTPCFPVTSVATPNLRQDWRVSSNRNAIDGSDNNVVSGSTIVNNAPFGYFCDDILGMWIVTYFWYTKYAVGGRPDQPSPTANCNKVLAAFATVNGTTLDGTPIVKTGDQLHFLEGVHGTPASVIGGGLQDSDLPPPTAPCGAENNEDPGGADGGAVWLVCPTIADPRQGAIALDAFPDVVFKPSGTPLDPAIFNNFKCLQSTGQFCP